MSSSISGRVLAMLSRAADDEAPCPSNRTLANELGLLNDHDVVVAINALVQQGKIAVERMPSSRIVTICATGRSTARTKHPTRSSGDIVDFLRAQDGYRGPYPEHLRVERDPCGFCGVRADVGCAHRRVAA